MLDTRSKAEALASALLERDDIGALPLPQEAKRYARMRSGILFRQKGQAKSRLYAAQVAALTNQRNKQRGFRNYDGSAYTGRKAKLKEGGTADFLRKHGIEQTRQIKVERDPNHEHYLAIPVLDRQGGRWFNLFKVDMEDNPKARFKDRLAWLVRYRAGYQPGDVFETPLGRFLVTDVLGLKEI